MAGSGTIDGDVIEMTITTTGGMKIGFIFEGIVTGDEMSGTREISMRGMRNGGPPGKGPPDGDAPAAAPPGGGGPPVGGGPPGGGGDMDSISDEWTTVRN